MSVKEKLISLLPKGITDRIVLGKYFLKYGRAHQLILKEIKKDGKARIAFLASSLSMWKCQELVELLLRDARFEVKLILTPFVGYDIDAQRADMSRLRDYFEKHHTPYVDYDFSGKPYDLRKEFNPHVIFFVQTYEGIHCPEHDSLSFPDRLSAYVPYSFWPGNEPWGFDLPFHRKAWRIYYANDAIFSVAKSHSLIKARNGRIVGYPSADLFLKEHHEDVWKIKDKSSKRIIWAPHFTVNREVAVGEPHSSFFALHESMVELAKAHQERLQIAFKPHPRLKTELYQIWGKEKTDSYYQMWATMPNTQVETGAYVDLFMTSDALIHECGSFMIEYHYSRRPCIYVMDGFDSFYSGMNTLGKRALDLHYKGRSINDVEKFISDVVFNNSDPLKDLRESFYQSQLLPPNNSTTSQNIYNDLVDSLFQ